MEYASPQAFWAALTQRARNQARDHPTPTRTDEVVRRFVVQRFLGRLFTDDHSPWVVAGGTGMLIRIPGARDTDDLDLVRRADIATAHADAAAELSTHAGASPLDPFHFTITTIRPFDGTNDGTKLRVLATIGKRRAAVFDVDVAAGKDPIAAIEQRTPEPTITDLRGLPDLPPMALYPVADQIADKLDAFTRHRDGSAVSTRYRDLVDLLLLQRECSVAADDLRTALTRINLTPDDLAPPGPQWADEYPRVAARTTLPRPLHDLDTAVDSLHTWLTPVLQPEPTTGAWNPATATWTTAPFPPAAGDATAVWVTEHTRDDGNTAVTGYWRHR